MKISRPVLLGGVLVIVALALVYLLLSDRDPTDTALAPEATDTRPADSAGTGGTTSPGGQATQPAGGKDGTGKTSTAATGTGTAATPTPPVGTADDTPTARVGGTGETSTTTTTTAGTGTAAAPTPPAGPATPPGTESGESRTAAAGTAQDRDVDTARDEAAAGTGTAGDTRAAATPGAGGQDTQVAAADSTRTDAAPGDAASSPVAIPVFRQPPAIPIPRLSPLTSARSADAGTSAGADARAGSAAPADTAAGSSASADTGAGTVTSVPGDAAPAVADATAPAAPADRGGSRPGAGQAAAAPATGDAAPTRPDATAPAAPAARKSEPAATADRGSAPAGAGQTAAAPATGNAAPTAPTVPDATAPAAPAARKGETATTADRGGSRPGAGQAAAAPATGDAAPTRPDATAPAAPAARKSEPAATADRGSAPAGAGQTAAAPATGDAAPTAPTVPDATAPAAPAARKGKTATTADRGGSRPGAGQAAAAPATGDAAPTRPDATAPAAPAARKSEPATTADRGSTRADAGQTALAAVSPPAADAPAAAADPRDQDTQIDIVRVDPQGNTVIAGRARPRSQIEVGDGTGLVGSTRANDAGEWVIVTEPIEPGDTILTLRETDENGTVRESRDAIIIGIKPPAADGTATAPLVAVVPRAGDPALTRPTRVIQTPQPAKPDAAGDDIPQVAEGNGPEDDTPAVTVDTVDYDEDGNVVLGGRADPDSTVQVYVDNKLSGTGTASDTGEWVHRSPQPISPGTHELRVDQVTSSGAVIHRVVLPFVRAEPFRSLPGQRVVIIQPGNNLWTIAYRVYGTGTRYTTIYQANADQIRDPDLIYPGQVFGLPKVEL